MLKSLLSHTSTKSQLQLLLLLQLPQLSLLQHQLLLAVAPTYAAAPVAPLGYA